MMIRKTPRRLDAAECCMDWASRAWAGTCKASPPRHPLKLTVSCTAPRRQARHCSCARLKDGFCCESWIISVRIYSSSTVTVVRLENTEIRQRHVPVHPPSTKLQVELAAAPPFYSCIAIIRNETNTEMDRSEEDYDRYDEIPERLCNCVSQFRSYTCHGNERSSSPSGAASSTYSNAETTV